MQMKRKVSRRKLLKGALATGALMATKGPWFWVKAQSRPLTVAVYGGIFKEVLDKALFEPFRKDTGIAVESRPEPTGEAMYVQLSQAVAANRAPVDVAIIKSTEVIKGIRSNLWSPYDEASMPNLKYVEKPFFRREGGKLYTVAALAWYINLVYNKQFIKTNPNSWADFWDPRYRGQLGLLSLPGNSYLLDIAAHTFFGGKQVLQTKEGIERVLKKIAELKPNVKLWYRDEATFEQALITGEVPMGQLYNDVTQVLVDKGAPVVSVFPKEGPIVDRGEWIVLRTSSRKEEAFAFINYASRPSVQQRITENLYTIPTVRQNLITLKPDLAERVLGPGPEKAIVPEYRIYLDLEDWLNERWKETIIG